MITYLRNIVLYFVGSTPHPFDNRPTTTPHVHLIDDPDDVIETSWGDQKIVKVRHQSGESVEKWELYHQGTAKLRPVDLDEYDWEIIRQRQLIGNNYKLVKPYVLAGWKNKEIAQVLGQSNSWVERLVPRVRDASKNRVGANPYPSEK